MTEEQFNKLKFHCKYTMALRNYHEMEFWNEEYGIGRLETTNIKTGVKDIQYYFRDTDKCYQTKKGLLKAIKDLRVISEDYETPSGCHIVDIRLKKKNN